MTHVQSQEVEQPGNPFSIKDLADIIPLITILGAASVVLSFTFELGYFPMVGFNFLTILSSSDYIHHALIILIFIFGVIGIFTMPIVYGMYYLRRKIHNLRKSEDSKHKERAGQLVLLDTLLGFAFSVIPIFVLLNTNITSSVLFMILSFLLFCINRIFCKNKLAGELIGLATISIISSIVFGADLGSDALFNNPDKFYLKSTTYQEGKEILLIRFVDKGVLYILRSENKIEFTPWNQVKSIYGIADRKPETTLYRTFRPEKDN